MAKWCETCAKCTVTGKYNGCDNSCPVFGKSFEELAEIAVKYEMLKSRLEYLKDCAKSVEENEDSVFEDERSMAASETREIIEILNNLEI